ncbi:MAG: caspase family protein [Hyphomicrobiaceae bacterium]
MTTATIKALIATGFACCLAMPAAAQKHVALVLDNGAAQAAAPATPASRIAEGLERLHYRVIFGRQQDRDGMRKYINDFRGALKDAEVALFYFKGVTLDASGRNLLMASNAAPGNPIEQSAVPLDDVADLMTASRANVLLVDGGYADRTAESLARSAAGVSPGMARLRDRSRFMVAFANMPGSVGRSDAENPFAEALASYLTGRDVASADLGRQLRQDVFERTRGSQLPWVRSDIGTVRLAALSDGSTPAPLDTPVLPSFDRSAFVRAVQAELKRHQCYSGTIDGDVGAQTNSGLEDLAETTTGKKAPEIELASAKLAEFENWLEWSRKFSDPICEEHAASTVRRKPVPTVSRHRPAPRERIVERPRRERQARSGRGDQDVRNTGVLGRGRGDFYAPSNPFNSPTR